MNKFLTTGAALLLTTTSAFAAGLDRTGQPIGIIFEDGDYAELSFGLVSPTVSGVAGGVSQSGDITPSYFTFGGGVKRQINDQFSLAVIYDQPFGASVDYLAPPGPGYPVAGFEAELRSFAITALGRYEVNDRFSVHGGLRYVTLSGTVNAGPNTFEYEGSGGLGYVVGAAYEIPDIALRAALTYSSETQHENDITVNGLPTGATNGAYVMPQSVNLDFQTGVAADTLLLASVRWSEWSETSISTAVGVIDYDNDGLAYSLGVARRFNDQFAGVLRVGYEAANGGLASNLSPTDGSTSITLAGIYTMDDMTVTAGISYVMLGDATAELTGAEFSGNSALGVGVKIGYNF